MKNQRMHWQGRSVEQIARMEQEQMIIFVVVLLIIGVGVPSTIASNFPIAWPLG